MLLFGGNRMAARSDVPVGHHDDRMTARGWALPLALLVLATSACSSEDAERPLAADDHDRLLGLWERDDRLPPTSEFRLYEGEAHCDMDSALILDIRWPLDGGITGNANRSFVRDPEGVFAEETVESFDPDAELPDDAIPTGYEKVTGIELWLANDLSTAYAVGSDAVEAWPALPGWGCA